MKLTQGTPEQAGVEPELLDRLRSRAMEWVQEDKTQALVLLAARKGTIFFHEAFGVHSPEEGASLLKVDAIFPLASLTKPVTATALMLLVEEGLVGLNRPVQEYLPEFVGRWKERVMVHHLLTHTSGIDDQQALEWLESPPAWIKELELTENQDPFTNKVLALTYASSLQFQPGERMSYSDLGYYLAGEIVHRVSGLSLDQFTRKRIFQPLEMEDSYYILPETLWPRVVRRPEGAPAGDRATPQWFNRPSPSGGLYSTAVDMAKFCQMFLNEGGYGGGWILSPAAVAAMTRNQIPGRQARLLDITFPEASWGLGWSVAHPLKGRVYGESLPSDQYFSHGGHGGVEAWVDPASQVLGVYFSVSLELDALGYSVHNAGLFINMVSSGISDGGAIQLRDRTSFQTPPVPHHILQEGSSEEAGASPYRLKSLREQALSWVEAGIHPSLVMLAAREGIVFLHEALGHRGPEAGAAPLSTDAVFPLASITKPITATALMILVEEGLVGINQPVKDYIKEFAVKGKENVTVRHLLTHTSGLRDEEGDDESTKVPVGREALKRYFMERLEQSLASEPNSLMVYADINYDLLGEIVARVSGMSLADFAKQRIFQPLGMTDTSFTLSEDMEGRLVRRPEEAYFAEKLASWPHSGLGSAGAVSTAWNLAVFGRMFLNGGSYGGMRILSPASAAAMTRNQIPGIPFEYNQEKFDEGEWGFGWSVQLSKRMQRWGEHLLYPGAYSHGGSGGVMIWIDPSLDLVVVFLSTVVQEAPEGEPIWGIDLFINALVASLVAGSHPEG